MSITTAFLVILSIPLWGYLLLKSERLNATLVAWVIAISFIPAIYFCINTTPLTLMFLYISSTFLTLKIVVANNHLKKEGQLAFLQWSLFCYGWFGMNPSPFKSIPSKRFPDFWKYILKGTSRIIIGVLLISIMRFLFFLFTPSASFLPILHLSYLIGLSLILHFGILNISTGFLRLLGINATSLFKDPIKSKSLEEFWSRRWNLAFVELTTLAVLRPLKKLFGPTFAFWASYIFSGLLHELAISLPVKSGFGKPFIYFILQAIFILAIEKPLFKNVSNSFIKKCWLLACLFTPIFLLFHNNFIQQIVIPLGDFFSFVMPF